MAHDFVNPFEAVRTEQFNDDYPAIATLFHQPWEFDKIVGRGHVIMEGGRGSGKTMILKYLSFEGQLAELERNGKHSAEYNKNFIGVYLKVDPGPFDLFAQNKIRLEGWENIFGHFFNVLATLKVLETTELARQKIGFEIGVENEERILKKVLKKFHIEPEIIDVPEVSNGPLYYLIEKLEDDLDAIQAAADNYPLRKSFEYEGTLTNIRKTFYDACNELISNIPFFKDNRICFYLLIDEYDNLHLSQQRVINTLLQKRDYPMSFKIGIKKKGLKTNKDISGRILQVPHDYEHISLDYEDPHDSEYKKYLNEIANKRLKNAGTRIGIKDILPRISLEEEIEKNVLNEEEKKRDLTGKDKIMEMLHKAKKKDVQYDKYKVAIAFQLLSKKHLSKKYWGFDTFCLLSSGITRSFIRLCKEAWSKAEYKKTLSNDNTPILKIEPEDQHDAVIRISDEEYDKIPENIDVEGHRLQVQMICNIFGSAFRKILLDEKLNQPEKLRIEIMGAQNLDRELSDIFDAGVSGSVFQELKPDNPKEVGAPLKTIALNRILAPHYSLSYRDRWSSEISAQVLNSILGDPQTVKDYMIKNKKIAPGTKRFDGIEYRSDLLDPDHLPGSFEKRVFVGGNYDFMANLGEITRCVENLEFQPIFAYDYDIPETEIHDYDCRLLHNCKYAIFEVTIPAGELMELERARDYNTKVLIVYQIRNPNDRSFPPQVSSMVKTFGHEAYGYFTFDELYKYIREWLEKIDKEKV